MKPCAIERNLLISHKQGCAIFLCINDFICEVLIPSLVNISAEFFPGPVFPRDR